MLQNFLELNIIKPTKLFEWFSSFGRCGKEGIDLQHNIFHIYSELVKSMLHCVVQNMGMAVSLQQIFLLLLPVGEDRVLNSIIHICVVCSALNAVTWSNDKPNLSSDCSVRATIPAADSSAFSMKSSILLVTPHSGLKYWTARGNIFLLPLFDASVWMENGRGLSDVRALRTSATAFGARTSLTTASAFVLPIHFFYNFWIQENLLIQFMCTVNTVVAEVVSDCVVHLCHLSCGNIERKSGMTYCWLNWTFVCCLSCHSKISQVIQTVKPH